VAYAKNLGEIRVLIAQHKRWDAIFAMGGLTALMIGVLTFVALFVEMAVDGGGRLSWDFFTNYPSRRPGEAGILTAWVGSTLVMLTTASFAVPLGVGAGIYLEEYAPKNWVTDIIEINITNLAGVPSIVYGLLALGLFVYQFGFGQSILSAGLTLALLILPVVIVATREAIRSIPIAVREGAYAMGATKFEVIRKVVLPAAVSGIMASIILAMGRAIGETMAVMMVTGNAGNNILEGGGGVLFSGFRKAVEFGWLCRWKT
jgi:phosphate transport system permease protein